MPPTRNAGAGGPLISVVMPAYDDERFVERAVRSCLAQDYQNIEVICVDDASADGTLAALERLAAEDGTARVKVVALGENGGPHNARRAGVAQASGELITFLDADDELARGACARMAAEYARRPADILHFATAVKRDGTATADQALGVAEWVRPLNGELAGRAILERSFVDLAYSYGVWAKAYRADVARRAFDALDPRASDFGEDALEYFALAYFASSYRGVPASRAYVYHLGDGLSARRELTAEGFARTLRGIRSVEAVRAFLEGQGVFAEYADIYEAHRAGQLGALLRSWLSDVRQADRAEAGRAILDAWPQGEVVDAACGLGTPVVEAVRSALGSELELSRDQAYRCGMADGKRAAREEQEARAVYRAARAVAAIPRTLRAALMK